MTVVRYQLFPQNLPVRAFDSRAQGFSPPLARQRSSCPPPSPNLVRTHLIENYQALRDSAPCLSRASTLPKGTKLELGRGAHLKTPSSANHTAAASQATGRIAKAASWLHLSRVSPALHPPERPSHTHTLKPGFGGRGHEMSETYWRQDDVTMSLGVCVWSSHLFWTSDLWTRTTGSTQWNQYNILVPYASTFNMPPSYQ